MKALQYPLSLQFKITTLSNDFSVTDAEGRNVAYVRQKMLKLREHVDVYEDTSKANQIYTIKANQWLDFSASYAFLDKLGTNVGRIARQGWSSLWRARYLIFDADNQQDFIIHEENGWVKVLDSLLGEIPILNFLTGYFFNPSYIIERPDRTPVARLKKQPSFWGRKFSLEKSGSFNDTEEERIILGSMMMLLLERRRG